MNFERLALAWIATCVIVMAALSSGCSSDSSGADGDVGAAPPPSLAPITGQSEFAPVAWWWLGQTDDRWPQIAWEFDLDCGGDLYRLGDGSCANGDFVPGQSHVTVAFMQGKAIHDTSLCHEYQHVVDARAGRPFGHPHEVFFAPDGPVERCRAGLTAAGW